LFKKAVAEDCAMFVQFAGVENCTALNFPCGEISSLQGSEMIYHLKGAIWPSLC